MTTAYDSTSLRSAFSASAVTQAVRQLLETTKTATRTNWLRAVAALTTNERPDLAEAITAYLGVSGTIDGSNPLEHRTIGEIGVCYEALVAMSDRTSRKAAGQYFTPDDTAHFMAQQSADFPEGTWMDPCCGVGNLAWHLAAAQEDPARFVREHLVLLDIDETALRTAVVLIAADFLAIGDLDGFQALQERASRRDFLAKTALPEHDYVIVNPPYARTAAKPGYRTHATREFFAYFLERIVTTSKGYISVTPASYLSAPKFQVLRDVLEESATGGRIFVFDNVPDTLFRGYKFGSTNTSSTNFVRAAITVCSPGHTPWEISPIIRWKTSSRARMLSMAPDLLAPRQVGSDGEWVKLPRGLEDVWQRLSKVPTVLNDLRVSRETPFSLTVGLTPRYYISAAYRELERGSKAVIYFKNEEDRDRAALVLNSSVPYLWWRALDGGVTLPKRVLFGTPMPDLDLGDETNMALIHELRETEEGAITTKLNAGLVNENVKRSQDLVTRLNRAVLDELPDLRLLYSEDMAALA